MGCVWLFSMLISKVVTLFFSFWPGPRVGSSWYWFWILNSKLLVNSLTPHPYPFTSPRPFLVLSHILMCFLVWACRRIVLLCITHLRWALDKDEKVFEFEIGWEVETSSTSNPYPSHAFFPSISHQLNLDFFLGVHREDSGNVRGALRKKSQRRMHVLWVRKVQRERKLFSAPITLLL